MVRPVLILLHHDEVQGVQIMLLFQLGTVCNHVLLLLQTLVTGKENAARIVSNSHFVEAKLIYTLACFQMQHHLWTTVALFSIHVVPER